MITSYLKRKINTYTTITTWIYNDKQGYLKLLSYMVPMTKGFKQHFN